jgi:hypothetical protein
MPAGYRSSEGQCRASCGLAPPIDSGMMANVRANPGRTQRRAAYPQRRSPTANGLRGQNTAESP